MSFSSNFMCLTTVYLLQVKITMVSDLNIYFFLTGQILRNSNINRLSLANRENVFYMQIPMRSAVKYFAEWDISLSMEYLDFSETHGPECLENQQHYDQCIISQFLSHGNNSRFSELFLHDASQWSSNKTDVSLEVLQDYYITLLNQHDISNCPQSCTYIKVQNEQKANRNIMKMKIQETLPCYKHLKDYLRLLE